MSFSAVLALLLLFLTQACGDPVVGQDGVFYPFVGGVYTQETATKDCGGSFDTTVTVLQNVTDLIMEPGGTTFTSLTGSVDKDGKLTFTGVNVDPTSSESYSCAGTYLKNKISLVCTSSSASCSITFSK